jgi:hypothetical protein
MTQPIYDENILSDLYKTARGWRPSSYYWEAWKSMSVEEKNAEYLRLSEEAARAILEEKEAELAAQNVWEFNVRHNTAAGISRRDFIRWDMEAHGTDDVGYYLWMNGIHSTEFVERISREVSP